MFPTPEDRVDHNLGQPLESIRAQTLLSWGSFTYCPLLVYRMITQKSWLLRFHGLP